MTQHAWNTSEADEIDLVAGYGTAVAATATRLSSNRSYQITARGVSFSAKETIMTQDSTNASELDEIEFTAGYGTAVAMPRMRRSTVRNSQAELPAGARSEMTNGSNFAADSEQVTRSPDSSQADDITLTSAPPPARRSIRLAAAPGAGKGRRRKPEPAGEAMRRRKAA